MQLANTGTYYASINNESGDVDLSVATQFLDTFLSLTVSSRYGVKLSYNGHDGI